ncbi:hypothetical protein J4217_02790 [Candidatus Pacearchaeota archaeon]|nr:hypothetical protein [Candidatus Pacearchaeota archaeon]
MKKASIMHLEEFVGYIDAPCNEPLARFESASIIELMQKEEKYELRLNSETSHRKNYKAER